MVIVALVLLIAAPRGNLLLSRAARDRQRSLFAALARVAGDWCGNCLTESLLLAVMGGVRMLLAQWGISC